MPLAIVIRRQSVTLTHWAVMFLVIVGMGNEPV